MEWIPAPAGSLDQNPEPGKWPEGEKTPALSTAEAPAATKMRTALPTSDILVSDGVQGSAAAGSPSKAAPSPSSQASSLLFDRSISSSSTCSSLAGSSQESDDVFSDTEQRPQSGKKWVLRKTKSWKTFFTMVHWSLRRRSSWVQLAGHEGNFRPSEAGQILKKFSAVEEACLVQLMSDILCPFVPAYHGVVEVGGECFIQMDDLLSGLENPSIMDCKMGTRTYLEDELGKDSKRPAARRDLYQKMMKIDPSALTAEEHSQGAVTKARYMRWRETTSSSASLGFRVEGITVEGGAVQRDFKRTQSREQIVEVFLQFTKRRTDVLNTYLARLESLREALAKSAFFKTHEVIGSSLLFLHDQKDQANVWMIDFGKTLPAPADILLRHDVAWSPESHEDGYLIGLQHLTDTVRLTLSQAGQGQEPAPGQL